MGQEYQVHNLCRGKQPAQPAPTLLSGQQGPHNAGGILWCEGECRIQDQSLSYKYITLETINLLYSVKEHYIADILFHYNPAKLVIPFPYPPHRVSYEVSGVTDWPHLAPNPFIPLTARSISAYAVNSEHGLVVVDDKYIAFFAQIYTFHPTFGRKSVSFRPNLHFLPHIWAKISRFSSKSTLFTPHLGENRLLYQNYCVSLPQNTLSTTATSRDGF